MMTAGSLFTGIGSLDLGFERAGGRIGWQCEKDGDCRWTLNQHWPDVPCYDDVEILNGPPNVDVLCGGFPCQDLSVAGRRAGLAGERSRLFHQFMRLAGELAPRWVLIENVPGLLSSNDGRDLGVVLGVLADLGYGWAYRVLDAQYFGVAQRRRRVFIVGCAGDAARAAQVLFEPESCDGDSPPRRETGTRVAASLTAGTATGRGVNPPGRRQEDDINIVAALTRNGVGACGADDNQAQAGHLLPVDFRNGTIGDDVTGTLQAHHESYSVNAIPHLIPSPARALTASDGGSSRANWALTPAMQVRRLTPVECERLQGFPDDWTAGRSDSARYRMLGNAVCVAVAEWIARRIMESVA